MQRDCIKLEDWREEMERCRNEVLLAIKFLTRAFLSGEDLSDQRIGQQLAEIGRAIAKFGITDEMICQAVKEAREEAHPKPPKDDAADQFGNIVPFVGPVRHPIDKVPELRALRVKRACKTVGGHALARKLADR